MTTDPKSSTSSKKPAEDGVGDSTRLAKEQSIDSSSDIFEVNEATYAQIGRYKILSQLGRGGFGMVFRAFDPELNCQVAIKIPRPDRVVRPGELERFRNEARTLARIRNHPSIVTVYDVGQTEDGITFAVMEFVEGEPLSRFIESHELTIDESMQILSRIAEALTAAHKASIVHRDLKPSNVILDKNRNITLVDFGLALHDDLSLADLGDAVEGTPRYMAPEQLRGENHRIDGQTDIWGFGVIMYRMLTGKHPYRGKDTREIARAIRYKDARPLRQLNPEVSREIERICLKCLSKNMSDRYLSVPDLMEELKSAIEEMQSPRQSGSVAATQALQQNYSESEHSHIAHDSQRSSPSGNTGPSVTTDNTENPLQITYKGLRPFDSNDSQFFMQLLPGPQTREGIPESIQFWRSRILGDELEPLDVGLIYGPSGCGKSSFVRAGLLPVLPAHVNPVYLECTSEHTERRLAQQIAHRIDSVDGQDSLSDILRQIRRGLHLDPEDKLLIVLDQFEQWLHGNGDYDIHELTEALRQCDGEKISCILLIRDDFWMSTSELMKCLDIPIREGHNALALPLFDERHARKVLVAYGRSFDRLAQSADESGTSLNAQQSRFVRDAVKSLAQNGKVICVHLSVFAQIAKDRQWTASELSRLGGLKGVGVRFLDDLFPAQSSSRYRSEQDEIVKSIFRDLLPGNKTVIKGTSRTRDELWQALDGKHSRQSFEQVLERMESELRLISLVDEDDPDEHTDETSNSKVDSYRLTHDFLVGPIREWLDRKQKETRRGRATHRLLELGEAWNSTHDACFIPGVAEYSNFLFFSSKRARHENAELMNAAGRRYLMIVGVASILIGMISLAMGYLVNDGLNKTAIRFTDNFLIASSENAAFHAGVLEYWQDRAKPQLEKELQSESVIKRLRASSFLITHFGTRQEYVDSFSEAIKHAPNAEFLQLASAIDVVSEKTIDDLTAWASQLEDEPRRVRFSMLLLGCNRPALAAQVLDRQNSYGRSFFIKTFPDLVWSLQSVLDVMESTADSDLESGLCLAIGNFRKKIPGRLGNNQSPIPVQLFQSKFNDGDSSNGVRSASEYVLRSSGANPEFHDSVNNSDDGWKSIELAADVWTTFARIPGGTFDPANGLTEDLISLNRINSKYIVESTETTIKPFYLCTIPVTRSLYHRFTDQLPDEHELKSANGANSGSVDDNCLPATGIKWHHAVEFCNWLSDLHGLPRYYQLEAIPESQLKLLEEFNIGQSPINILRERWVAIDRDGPGFRLPFTAEWQFAYKANTNTLTPFTNTQQEPFWDLYSSFRQSTPPGSKFANVFEKMPNQFGLFDMAGNTSQWCNDIFEEYFHQRCGGHIRSGEEDMFSGVFEFTANNDSWDVESIRLAINVGPDGFFPETKPVIQNMAGSN